MFGMWGLGQLWPGGRIARGLIPSGAPSLLPRLAPDSSLRAALDLIS